MRLCAAIRVRCVVQFPLRYNTRFGRLREDNVMAIAFSMGSFGHYLPNPTILLGTDRLLLKGIKYLAARMFRLMEPPVDFDRMPATAAGAETSATFHFAAA
ncbi:Zdhhc3 [Symbiodinium sp. CCMP2456]|nr:Zdhhc3 [Symbiodinium sp. CCMP2456]